jgi:hypothetical protein
MRIAACVVGCLAVFWAMSLRPVSGDGFRPLLQSHYDAELARVQTEARIAQAEIGALPDPSQQR